MTMTRPEMRKVLEQPLADVLAKVPDALKTEGFGVLTQIDVSQTLKQKLGVDFRRYHILGACNPALAFHALQEELELGVMLPCNVIVCEADDKKTVVSAVDPMRTVANAGDNPRLTELAESVREKLARAIARVG
jgi:uncharacterized protein (DUF302 family)